MEGGELKRREQGKQGRTVGQGRKVSKGEGKNNRARDDEEWNTVEGKRR